MTQPHGELPRPEHQAAADALLAQGAQNGSAGTEATVSPASEAPSDPDPAPDRYYDNDPLTAGGRYGAEFIDDPADPNDDLNFGLGALWGGIRKGVDWLGRKGQ